MTAPTVLKRLPLWRSFDEGPADWGSGVLTLGVFDGVHRGHARLIGRAQQVGRSLELPTVLVTFDPHPARVLGIPRDTATLSTIDRRAELANTLGMDAVCVLAFTPELARIAPEEFVERVLVGALHSAAVVVGAYFTFGHHGTGDVDTLRRLGPLLGFTAHWADLLEEVDTPCSSTYVRGCLRRGDVGGAARALGRPHRVDGLLAAVGARTYELFVPAPTAIPAPGRYTGRLGGARPVDLEVTADGRVFVTATGLMLGRAGVDFLTRRGY